MWKVKLKVVDHLKATESVRSLALFESKEHAWAFIKSLFSDGEEGGLISIPFTISVLHSEGDEDLAAEMSRRSMRTAVTGVHHD